MTRKPSGPGTATVTRSYWYASDIYYCPICGHEDRYRFRVYDQPKPKEWSSRNHVFEAWDYCGVL